MRGFDWLSFRDLSGIAGILFKGSHWVASRQKKKGGAMYVFGACRAGLGEVAGMRRIRLGT